MSKRTPVDPLSPEVMFRKPTGVRGAAREAARLALTAPLPAPGSSDIFTMAGAMLRRQEARREPYKRRGMQVPKSMQHRPHEHPLPLHHQALRIVRGTASEAEQAQFGLAIGDGDT
jgi:hypothetical protein